MDDPTIEDYYSEDRTFPPSPEFVAKANRFLTVQLENFRKDVAAGGSPTVAESLARMG